MRKVLQSSVTKMLILTSLFCGGISIAYASTSGKANVAIPSNGVKVTGTVVDEMGEPMSGVIVRVVDGDASLGTVTDVDGNFTLTVPSSKSVLLLTSVGFKDQRVSLGGKSHVNVTMEEDIANLNEVVVIGYGTLEKKQVTSAITSIKAEDLNVGAGGADITTAMQGKIGGLVMSTVDDVNGGATIQLRGMTSINAGRSPLIVIDGFPGGDIRSLTMEDIKSIDVLKDASAGAIYGTRAASGVILITTKSGANTSGKLSFAYSNEFSHKQDFGAPEMLTGDEYREHNIGEDYGASTDWWKEMINSNNFSTKHHLSLNYGTDLAQIYTSLFYEHNEGVAIKNKRNDYGGRFNAHFKLFDGWLEVSPMVDYRQASRLITWPDFQQAIRNNPTRSPYDPNDPHGYNIWLNNTLDYNVVADAMLKDYDGIDKWFKPMITLKLNIKPVLGLSFQQTFGYENRQWENHTYEPSYMRSQLESGRAGTAYLDFSKTEYKNAEGYFSYIHEFGKHSVNGTLGYSYWEGNGESFDMTNYNFTVDGIKFWDMGAGTALKDGKASMSSGKNVSEKLFSVFARANYSYNDTYMASASIRHEGSSKFAKDNRWGDFWALSAGWRISNEKFMKDVKWVNDLKIRAAYGVTGNNNFSSSYMANLLGSDAWWLLPSQNWKKSYGKTQNVNDHLGWENKKEWNFGLDWSLFGGRFYGSFDYFIRNIDNLLFSVRVPQPPFTQDHQWQNIGEMQVKGWELHLAGTPIKSKDFTWHSDMNISHSGGKITTLYGDNTYIDAGGWPAPGSPGTHARIEAGTKIGQFHLWKWAGFDDEGKFLLYDKDNNVIPAASKTEQDKRFIGNYNPLLIIGWTNTFQYKNFDLGITLRSWIDFDVYNSIAMYDGIQGIDNLNVLKEAYGKYDKIRGEKQICDYYLEDGTFLKISNITLGYTIPMNKWTKYVRSIRVYGTVANLATITGYSGVNPEINVTGWDQGVEKFWDGNLYPQVRTWTLGMQFNF